MLRAIGTKLLALTLLAAPFACSSTSNGGPVEEDGGTGSNEAACQYTVKVKVTCNGESTNEPDSAECKNVPCDSLTDSERSFRGCKYVTTYAGKKKLKKKCSAAPDDPPPDDTQPDGGDQQDDAGITLPDGGPGPKPDGGPGPKPDGGPGPQPDGGPVNPPVCASQSLGSWAPNWVPPAATHQNKCTEAQVDDFFTSCIDSTTNCAARFGSGATASNRACGACLRTREGVAPAGPFVEGPFFTYTNMVGCMAATSNLACAKKVQAYNQCLNRSCRSCTVDSTDDEIAACFNTAYNEDNNTGVCAVQGAASSCWNTTDLSACTTNGSVDAMKVAMLFCGP